MRSDACPACKGVGYFYANVEPGEPRYGRAQACRTCDGYGTTNRYEAALREESGISDAMWAEWSFATFEPERDGGFMQPAYAAAVAWIDAPLAPFLMLMGSVGTGKTHLALAAARRLIERRTRCYFTTVPRLLEDLRETQRPTTTRQLADIRRTIEDVPALVLDDLGADRATDFAAEQLFLILDRRWQERRRTLITSNADSVKLIEARIRSRIMDNHVSRVVTCVGPDQRLAGGAS